MVRGGWSGEESQELGESDRGVTGIGDGPRREEGVLGREVLILAAELRAEVGVRERSKAGRDAFEAVGDESLQRKGADQHSVESKRS